MECWNSGGRGRTHGFVLGCYLVANSRTFQLAGVLVNRVDTAEKVVALTFDDGPAEHTPEVLDVLARSRVPATFYLNGADLDRYPEHGAAIARMGTTARSPSARPTARSSGRCRTTSPSATASP